MTIHALAPASTANLGPGFDAAAAALDLWNEAVIEESGSGPVVEIAGEGADELPRDASHLTLRAFALFAPVDRYAFRFTNRIPLERGLGSSAAAIALGLVAGACASGQGAALSELLALGETFEGHADNLAAALAGGVAVTWRSGGERRVARIATGLPLTPILAVPSSRMSTAQSRNGLPATVSHEDAAVNAAHAALLGAAVAAGDAALLAEAFTDRLHQSYRAPGSPLFSLLHAQAPAGAVGVTLSGSGPSVVVWAPPERAAAVAAAVAERVDGAAQVFTLTVPSEGARAA